MVAPIQRPTTEGLNKGLQGLRSALVDRQVSVSAALDRINATLAKVGAPGGKDLCDLFDSSPTLLATLAAMDVTSFRQFGAMSDNEVAGLYKKAYSSLQSPADFDVVTRARDILREVCG